MYKKHFSTLFVHVEHCSWLNVLPVAHHQFDLSAVKFRDALAMRYCWPLIRMPTMCDGCGAVFTLRKDPGT